MKRATHIMPGGTQFGMGKNFTRHKGAWNFLIKTSQNHKREMTN